MQTFFDNFRLKLKNHDPDLPDPVAKELLDLAYKQQLPAIIGEFLVILFLSHFLWFKIPQSLIINWLTYGLTATIAYRLFLRYAYFHYVDVLSRNTWSFLYYIGCFFSGTVWGITSVFFIPLNNVVYQTVIAVFFIGITSTSSNIYSSTRLAYCLFLSTALAPYLVWFYQQGGVNYYVGLSAVVYYIVMLISANSSYRLLRDSLILRFNNVTLHSQSHLLEKEVKDRTQELRQSLALIESTFQSTDEGLVVINLEKEIYFYNNQMVKMWNIPIELIKTILKTEYSCLILKQLHKPHEFLINNAIHDPKSEAEHSEELALKDGRYIECYSKPHRFDNQIVGRIIGFRDVTERRILEMRISYQANHDLLTQLPNRMLLYDRLDHSIELSKRYNHLLVVMFIDVDHFKDVNDVLGHHRGDLLLQALAERLQKSIRKSDTVARYDGDVFVILSTPKAKSNIIPFCQKIMKTIATPLIIGKEELLMTASMGVSVYPENGLDSNTLLKSADMALMLSKKKGLNHFQLYDEYIGLDVMRHQDIKAQLITGLIRHEFHLRYQPIIQIDTGEIVAVEALIRWNNPLLGELSPSEFIPIAEESGHIVSISEWVIKTACEQNKAWQMMGGKPIRMAVNISSVHLKLSRLLKCIDKALNESSLDPQYFEIELTESALMGDSSKASETLKALRDKGIHISIDDFGTGYCSFRYLKDFPVSTLKIDRTFIQNCRINSSNHSIINAIVTLGHELNLQVLAEGVETEEEFEVIKQSGCDQIQGFLYSVPLLEGDLFKLLMAEADRLSGLGSVAN